AVVAKESLPQKVWTVCVHCPKFSHCDEIAVRKYL
ncbi:MAG: GNAT family N-acetyltransferase, partial [Ghiorsea sp.]